ncbi:Gfo/Idh/MocA family protein [Zobellia russellii]|uniref:Gfo/Idh/MocA family protein n=1 Tax=Zobellia russellii TaxID=248907 RepID=UPI001BFFBED7|nr:Gfo/Idh/MocA family oxidoreductase [Zobellia russellii]MBT9189447.1 Gfo/Idh/MocA family oxidoreductase [Zobellia russellii]
MAQEIRWGIVGLGSIAHSFAKDLALVSGGRLTGVASRSMDKAKEFADEYGAPHTFDSYEALFKSAEVDVVYIATPHTLHEDLSIKAMENGKHVLCEKPMGVNPQEVSRMIASAKKNKVFLMEALWSRFNPSIQKAKQLVEQGEIGSVGFIHADFAFYALGRDPKNRLLNPNLAGGSLLDIGIYPIFLSYLVLGMPKNIQASSRLFKTGIEMQTSMIFEYEEAQAILYSGLNSKSEMKAEISGSEGSIFLHPRWHEAQGYSVEKDSVLTNYDLPTHGKGYTYEIEEVHACLASGELESKLWSHQNSKDLADLLFQVRQKTGVIFPFEQQKEGVEP